MPIIAIEKMYRVRGTEICLGLMILFGNPDAEGFV